MIDRGGIDHGPIAEQPLAGEGGHDLREDAEGRQDHNIDLGMPPDPEQVDIHHHVAAERVGEKMHAQIAVERQQGKGGGQNRKCKNHQHGGEKSGPDEHRHPHERHARSAHFQDRDQKIDAGHQRADAGDLKSPYPIVYPCAGAELTLDQGCISRPAGLGKFAHTQRYHDQQGPGCGQPEADRIHKGKRHIACPDLLRDDDIHQSDQKRHGHEDDHDRAVGAEYLVEVSGRQIAVRHARGQGLLRAHQDGIGEPAQQHDQRQDNIHDADSFVVEAGQPLFPEVWPLPVVGDQGQNHQCQQERAAHGAHNDRIFERYGRKA